MRHMNRKLTTLGLIGLMGIGAGFSSCTLAPDYVRPESPVAGEWPAGPSYTQKTAGQPAFDATIIDWEKFFTDQPLRQVIRRALHANRDLRVAVLNIEKTQARYRIQRAALIPGIDATAASNNQAADKTVYTVGLGVSSYQVDLFGRIRSLKEQALEQYLATEEAGRAVRISLIAEVANAYLNLAADRERLSLAKDTLKSQETTYQLLTQSYAQGITNALDLRQAQTQVESARIDVARFTTLCAQDINALDLLAGGSLAPDLLPTSLSDTLTESRGLLPGLPSTVLLNRPDVLQAEHLLKGYNASIGAARAAFFPTIALTSSLGYTSTSLSDLFRPDSGFWAFAPQITLPIFDGDSRMAQLEVAKKDRDIALAQYEKAIQSAFREVADALAQRGTIDTQLAAQQALVNASSSRYDLAQARYRQGIDSYLTVLDAQRSLYSAKQGLITTRLTRLNNQVTLYQVLGGGAGEAVEAQTVNDGK